MMIIFPRHRSGLRTLALSCACLLPACALAHGDLDARPFLSGTFHALTSALSYAVVIGLMTATVGQAVQPYYRWVGCVAIGAALGSLMLSLSPAISSSVWIQGVTAAVAAVVGLIGVVGRALPTQWQGLMALLCGGCAAAAAQLDHWSAWSTLGLISAITFITLLALTASADLAAWKKTQSLVPLVKRILGAWVACISLLLLALSIKQS